MREAWADGPATEFGRRFVPFAVPLLLLGAALSLDDGDLGEARAWLDAHGSWMDWMEATLGRSEGQVLEAQWWRASGNGARARDHAERALQYATAHDNRLLCSLLHHFLGSLDTSEGLGVTAKEHFAVALALADACQAPNERALVLLASAELAALTGESAEAITLLKRGACDLRAARGPEDTPARMTSGRVRRPSTGDSRLPGPIHPVAEGAEYARGRSATPRRGGSH